MVFTILFSIAALLILPGDCYRPPPIPHSPRGPTQVAVGETADYAAFLDNYYRSRVRYVFDWGDGGRDTTNYFSFEDTVTVPHAWDSIGTYPVAVGAEGDSDVRGVWWSDPLSVSVYSDSDRVLRDTFAD